jgi:hypothetical protein
VNRDAQRLLDGGLAAAGLSAKELDSLPGSGVRKVALANLLLERTAAKQSWIAGKLAMRSAANLSQQVRRYRAKRPRLTYALKEDLQSVRIWMTDPYSISYTALVCQVSSYRPAIASSDFLNEIDRPDEKRTAFWNSNR